MGTVYCSSKITLFTPSVPTKQVVGFPSDNSGTFTGNFAWQETIINLSILIYNSSCFQKYFSFYLFDNLMRLKLKTQTPHYFLHQWKILYFTKFITILKILLYTRVTLKCQKNTTIDIDQLWYYLGNLRHLPYFVKTNQSTEIIKHPSVFVTDTD